MAANLSFLAIESVDRNHLPPTERSVGQVVSYISLIFNVCNIAASTILARQHRSGHHSSFEGEVNLLLRPVTSNSTENLAFPATKGWAKEEANT